MVLKGEALGEEEVAKALGGSLSDAYGKRSINMFVVGEFFGLILVLFVKCLPNAGEHVETEACEEENDRSHDRAYSGSLRPIMTVCRQFLKFLVCSGHIAKRKCDNGYETETENKAPHKCKTEDA